MPKVTSLCHRNCSRSPQTKRPPSFPGEVLNPGPPALRCPKASSTAAGLQGAGSPVIYLQSGGHRGSASPPDARPRSCHPSSGRPPWCAHRVQSPRRPSGAEGRSPAGESWVGAQDPAADGARRPRQPSLPRSPAGVRAAPASEATLPSAGLGRTARVLAVGAPDLRGRPRGTLSPPSRVSRARPPGRPPRQGSPAACSPQAVPEPSHARPVAGAGRTGLRRLPPRARPRPPGKFSARWAGRTHLAQVEVAVRRGHAVRFGRAAQHLHCPVVGVDGARRGRGAGGRQRQQQQPAPGTRRERPEPGPAGTPRVPRARGGSGGGGDPGRWPGPGRRQRARRHSGGKLARRPSCECAGGWSAAF